MTHTMLILASAPSTSARWKPKLYLSFASRLVSTTAMTPTTNLPSPHNGMRRVRTRCSLAGVGAPGDVGEHVSGVRDDCQGMAQEASDYLGQHKGRAKRSANQELALRPVSFGRLGWRRLGLRLLAGGEQWLAERLRGADQT